MEGLLESAGVRSGPTPGIAAPTAGKAQHRVAAETRQQSIVLLVEVPERPIARNSIPSPTHSPRDDLVWRSRLAAPKERRLTDPDLLDVSIVHEREAGLAFVVSAVRAFGITVAAPDGRNIPILMDNAFDQNQGGCKSLR